MRSTSFGAMGRGQAATLAVALALAAGCEPPDRPPTRSDGFPEAALRYLGADRLSTFRLEEGATYRVARSRANGWTVHLLEVDLDRCEIGFRVVNAGEGEGRLSVREMARRSEPGVIAAVNGDFFTPESLPLGVEVSDGRMRGRTSRSVFAWRPGELPWVGPVEWADDQVRIGPWLLAAGRYEAAMQVVAGFPPLLEAGRLVGDLEQAARPGFASERHPRTGVGLDTARRRLWLAVVDGRAPDAERMAPRGLAGLFPEGMTLPEFAGLFRALGADDAINLDGGSSSVMVVRGEAVNRPVYLAGERPVVNGLVVRRDPAYCRAGAPSPGVPPGR